jgi:hypothetical protein
MTAPDALRDLAERLLAAASPGPWLTVPIIADESELATRGGEGIPHDDIYRETIPLEVTDSTLGRLVASADCSKRENVNVCCVVDATAADLALITQSPTLIRDLLAALLAAREERDRIEGERDRQYEENVARIAAQAQAENERDAALQRAEAAAIDVAVLRKLLLMHHGCKLGAWYVDDGELQCNECRVDFRRIEPLELERKWMMDGLAKLAARPAPSEEGPSRVRD